MTKHVLEFNNVNISFGTNKIIKDFSLKIPTGSVVALIGPNGSGKTTLLKAVLDLVDYSGEIKIFNKPAKLNLAKIGYVPQRFDFDQTFPITVNEFLALVNSDEKVINKSLKEVEMLKFKTALLGNLSGGQLQRVLIARALLNNPELLILDEPTSGVDMEGSQDFYSLVTRLNKEKAINIILVSHELSIVYKYADQVICLNKDLICFGTPKQAITQEVLDKLYGPNREFSHHCH